ncbi:MAG: hypothetical protein KOO69_07260 [Victivallales bacterium]|nr:hypothetical protein [Victivallales bacterium]
MNTILDQCNAEYKKINTCPKGNPPELNLCHNCSSQCYFDGGKDFYDCEKWIYYYAMHFGPIYVSEIYHFLDKSKMLENFQLNNFNVLSLGGGLCTDYLALNKYIKDKNLNLNFNYTVIDKEPLWSNVRKFYKGNNIQEIDADITQGFNPTGYDVIFLNKFFSTLKNNKCDQAFLQVLESQIVNMKKGTLIVFNDINHTDKGSNIFDAFASRKFKCLRKYFFPLERAYTESYTPIENIQNIFTISDDLEVTSKNCVTKAVFFVYQKE